MSIVMDGTKPDGFKENTPTISGMNEENKIVHDADDSAIERGG